MNKKVLALIIVLLIIALGVGAFFFLKNSESKNENQSLGSSEKQINTSEEKNILKDSKILVVYFSMKGETYNVGNVKEGNTKIMAKYISDYLNADSFEIVPAKEYTTDYDKLTEIAKKEQKENARPEIKNKISDFDIYDTIFIGYPIWWGDLPMIMYTFLENYNFSGKNVFMFNTHEGSGDSGTYEAIKSKISGATINPNGLAVQGKTARTKEGKDLTIKWLKSLGYNE